MNPRHNALKRAFGDTVTGVGVLEEAEKFCRVGKTVLATYYSTAPAHAKVFPPVDVIADLESLSRDGTPHVTMLLCRLHGGVFVRVPVSPEVPREDLLGSVARLAKEHSDIASAILTGLADDGRLDRAEVQAAREQVREGQQVLAALDAQLGAMIGDAP